MEPAQVARLTQADQASHVSQPDGLETTRPQALSAVSDGSEITQTELTELLHTTEDAGAVQLGPAGEQSGQCSVGDHPATLRTPGDSTQHVLPGNGKSACYAANDDDEMDGYLPRSPSALSQGQVNSGQAKEEALKDLAYSATVQKTITPLTNLPLKASERPQEPDELQTMTEPTMAHAALPELNQHELSSEILDASETPHLTTGETTISMGVNVEQVLQNVPIHGGVCLDASGNEILSSLSAGESKVLGDETCTETILTVTDGIQAVVTSSTDVVLNDGESVSGVLSPNPQQTNSISITHSETLEGLGRQLLSTSQIDHELLTHQMPSPVPAADTFSEMEVCTNAEGIIETQTTEIHTHVLRDLGQVCFLQTDLVSDLSSLPVEILEHEVEEGTWLHVTEPLGDGQVVECTEAQLMDVGDGAHCLEAQTIEVSECTVVTYPSDAILSHGQLHLPDSLEVPQVCESTLGSSVEFLTEDLGTDAPSPHNGVAGLKVDPEPTAASYVESTTSALTPTAALVDSAVQGVDELLTDNKTEVARPSAIDPKLLILKRGDTPLLKHPPDIIAVVSKKPSPVSVAQALAGSPSCASMSAAGASAECLSPSTPATAAAAAGLDPSLMGISPPAPIPRKLTFLSEEEEEALTSTDMPSETVDRPHTAPDSPPRRSERQPLMGVWSEVCGSIGAKRETAAGSKRPVGEPNEMGQGDGPDTIAGESSDGEVDLSMESHADSIVTPTQRKHGQCRTDRQSVLSKVRQWISGRVTAGSTPSSSPSPSPGPSTSGDWTPIQMDRASPLRGSHGKFLSPHSKGDSSQSDQTPTQRLHKHADMAELAKHEAEIEHRSLALKREGFWSLKRLNRLTEPIRPKVHWDYLCEEMQWLSADFAQERRWKRGVARKVVRMVMRYHEELRQKEERAKREEQAKLRRVAASIAKEVRAFWTNVEKVVQYKQQSRLEEKRKKALDLQLDFIVGQTERYSDLLSQSLAAATAAPATNTETPASPPKRAVDEDDHDFEPPCEEEDDEETIEVEEQQEGNDAEAQRREIELLREEGELPLDQLLNTISYPPPSASDEECSNSSSSAVVEEDEEFTANEEDAEDEEETIEAQEEHEGDANHEEELDDLAKEGEMSVAELLEKYKGAYTSDFEEPSGSASPATSEEEESTEEEEEEESEGEDSDDETNSSSDSSEAVNSDDDVIEDEEEEEAEDDEEEDDDDPEEGMEALLKEGEQSPPLPTSPRPKKEISHIAATAESLQPKGYTLATTKVKTPIPFLLHGTLREYQHIGLDWLVTMYEKKLNGILADEMGLGKTIQTIALLAHLACEKGNWGPHLIIVPTSVMLNWEMELKRWCPGFKILTYYGSQKERKLKRQGWTKPNAFHVCITSYKLVLQDHQAFRRKSWRYLILDEAQNIKNFKSQRWQSLLNFNSHRRLLLTGTPLQNSLMELWSLMHFLMPHVFQSHREFKEWFSNPLTGMIEGSQEYNEGLVKRLHKVLRPFLLRRVKVDVEKQMPKKYEHVVRCRLSKRQRFLYDDFMAQASTRETLASGHFMSVINILMQLRKVCNHPNLFDPRPIHSPFITEPIIFTTSSVVQRALETSPFERCDLSMFDLVGLEGRVSRYQADVFLPRRKVTTPLVQEIMDSPEPPPRPKPVRMKVNRMFQPMPKTDGRASVPLNNPRPTCPVAPVVQPPRPALITEVHPAPAPIPVQPPAQVCSMMPTAATYATAVASAAVPVTMTHTPAAALRPSAPHPILTVRPPTPLAPPVVSAPSSVVTQRVLLSPDMQARLPSGEVVSIAQLASLAGRPVPTGQGSKPVTFQLQGNKLTLSGTQLHQVPVQQPRALQGNVMHLVSSGGQHHLISQPAQVALIHTVSQAGSSAASPSPAPVSSGLAMPLNAAQVPSSMVTGSGIVKIVVRQAGGKETGPVPALAVPPSPRVAPPVTLSLHPHTTTAPLARAPPPQRPPVAQPTHYAAPPRTPTSALSGAQPPRPILRVLQGPPPAVPPPAAAAAPVPVEPVRVNATPVPAPREENSDVVAVHADPPVSKPSSQPGSFSFQRPRAQPPPPPRSPFHMSWLEDRLKAQRDARLAQIIRVNEFHCNAKPVYGQEVLDFLTFLTGPAPKPASPALGQWSRSGHTFCLLARLQRTQDLWVQSETLRTAVQNTEERLAGLSEVIDRFTFAIPPVEAQPITMHSCHPPPSLVHQQALFRSMLTTQVTPLLRPLHRIQCNMRTHFPDLRLIQYDCGKLQTLHLLLRKLKTGGHRVLIFTQMTRMLDVLEQFLNYHGHIYLRLDGSTRVEQRQSLMERFNADRRIFCFILSTRSGGVGVNLTGADTVVFYDSDWNPTMDAQAQDRCHRIGQTRDVHIYRLISERTVEENILKKANQKRMLGDMAIEGGNFTTAFFKQQTIKELFDVTEGEKKEAEVVPPPTEEDDINKQQTTILEQALCRAEDEEDIVAASQAKAEQVAELAEFNESIPLDDGAEGVSRDQEEEELSKAEQEIAALVEQLTPIERYAMNFLEASLEDICKEELKQAEEQVEAARKGLDQAKEEGLKLHQSSDNDEDDYSPMPHTPDDMFLATPARRTRKHKEKGAPSTRASGRLRGTPAKTDDDSTLSPASTSAELERANASMSAPTPPRQVPDRRGGQRGRPPTKEAVAPTTPARTETRHTDSTSPASPLKDVPGKSRATPSPLRQSLSPPSSVPSTAGSPAAGRSHAEHAAPAGQERVEEVRGDVLSGVSGLQVDHAPVPSARERGVSVSSGSICSPEHQSDLEGRDLDQQSQHSLTLSPSMASRSPRKRQSADGEVLKGLPEDSPSAKVLRKLPGRLVTVVEEKEKQPRRRRRRGSGGAGHTEGSSEEAEHTESERDTGPSSPDKSSHASRDKDTPKSPAVSSSLPQPQEKEQVSPASLGSPGKGYHPYSPTHPSPDMPVLRNLPVRRRLETESRMAAQLGEQHGGGRGRWPSDRRQSLSPNPPKRQDASPTKDGTLAPATVNTDNPVPVKRKPGRPPKRPVEHTVPPPAKPVIVEKDAPVSPKRKRGRPRKDSTIKLDAIRAAQSSNPPTPSNPPPSTKSTLSSNPSKSTSPSNPPPLSKPTLSSNPPPASESTPPSNLPPPSKSTLSSNPPPPSKSTSPSNPPPPSKSTLSSNPPPPSNLPPPSKPTPPSNPPPHSKSSLPSNLPSSNPPLPLSPPPPSNPTLLSNAPPPCSPKSMQSGLNSPRSSLSSLQEALSESAPVHTPLPSLPAKAADKTSLPKPVTETNITLVTSPTPTSNSLTNETPTAMLAQSKSSESQTNTPSTESKTPCVTSFPSAQPTATSDSKTTSAIPALPVEPKPSDTQNHSSPTSPSQSKVRETPIPSTHEVSQPSQGNTQKTVTALSQVPQSTSNDSETKPIPESKDSQIDTTLEPRSSVQVTPSPAEQQTDPMCAPTHTPAEPEPPPASEPSQEPAPALPIPQGALEVQEKETAELLSHEKTSDRKEAAKTDTNKDGEKEIEEPSLGPQSKRRRVESLPEDQESVSVDPEVKTDTFVSSEGTSNQSREEGKTDGKDGGKSSKKRAVSRQSSQDSVRSSSPSSVSSAGTRSSKKMADNRSTKRKRGEAKTGGSEDGNDEKKPKIQRRRSNSPSSSSDSDDSSRKEKRLTRAERKKQEKENQSESDGRSSDSRRGRRSKKEQVAANATAGDSGSETSTKVTCKSSGPSSTKKSSTTTPVPSTPPPQPEVLGKRCSALNAAAKLLAMRGRAGDIPRPSNKVKVGDKQESPSSSEKSTKSKGKGTQGSPQTNSSGSRGGSGRQTPTNTPLTTPELSRSISRSTRQRPGSLLPPLDAKNKRAKRDKKKNEERKEDGEDENRESRSSRGHSACSSISSDREAGSSRSRSSSNSSQCTPSLSSQSTGPHRPRSRATSSGSDTERGKQSHSKSGERRGRKSHRETRSQKHDRSELSGGSAEGTPDRVLRSVAALAAAHARSPACNTRSSATQHRHTKT
ncbi:helicase SRCAP isoform X2 [Alosa sapidissima]|uniref:helicase SRCAP isoform X2 n=1 Tax=Alosa sapidissima TaxID=34773 RepID=UPI001C08068A|nr:helicase SRCAP isoform X2 [Alosa sapidissima]